jgi:hypothetical protein
MEIEIETDEISLDFWEDFSRWVLAASLPFLS